MRKHGAGHAAPRFKARPRFRLALRTIAPEASPARLRLRRRTSQLREPTDAVTLTRLFILQRVAPQRVRLVDGRVGHRAVNAARDARDQVQKTARQQTAPRHPAQLHTPLLLLAVVLFGSPRRGGHPLAPLRLL